MNTKICTSIEQSKKLLSLGLDPSTADMHYEDCIEAFKLHASPSEYGYEYNIPAWSLTALLELMPDYTAVYKKTYRSGKVAYRASMLGNNGIKYGDSAIDVAFKTMCWLIEQGHIKVNK